ncbi:MAG TPA: glutathione S-transferase family protein [Kofleriaceae bacterium]|nr:glutathione S-transferase family protein [Kofleriaceae bacterium]
MRGLSIITDMMSTSLTLVSHPLCPFVHRATAMLHEKGVPFETRYVDLRAKPDWFLAVSPRGKVPVLIADGVALFESAAIVEFLDETNPPRLLPADPYERARQRAWVEVANDLFTAHYKLVIAATPQELGDARAELVRVLARFEEGIRGDFFAGDSLGIVDLAAAPALFRLSLLQRWSGLELLARRPIAAWSERLATRSSVVRGVPPDFEALFRASVTERGAFPIRAS